MTHLSEQAQQATDDIVLTDEERQPCEVWTRVMGYHRPVSSFNTGKKGEYHERRFYREQHCGRPAQEDTEQLGRSH
jgi:Anaerobic ribonucleoside-triphosphate reductase